MHVVISYSYFHLKRAENTSVSECRRAYKMRGPGKGPARLAKSRQVEL